MPELLAIVKHDCPVCDQVLPALDAAGARLLSQSDDAQTAEQAARLALTRTPELDPELVRVRPPGSRRGPGRCSCSTAAMSANA